MPIAVEQESELKPASQTNQDAPSRPARICFLIDNLNVAGTEKHLLSLIARLDRTKLVPILCLLNGETEISRQLEPCDCEVLRLGVQSLKSSQSLRAARQFVHLLRKHEANIVQAFFPDSTYFGIPLAKFAGVPVQLRTRRNAGYWMTNKHRLLGRVVTRLATGTIANSEACKEAVVKQEGASPDSVFVIPNGVDLTRFRPATKINNSQRLRIGAVANLRPVKNLALLVKAAAELTKKYEHLEFQIVGEGPCREQLQREIDRFELKEKFQLLGQLPDIPKFLQSLDLAVLCSSSEGTSNAIVEYMATGLPIVATDVGGNSHLIRNQVNGLLIPSDDVAALVASLDRLVTEPQFARSLGHSARMTAERDHSSLAETKAYEQLYLRLCRGKLNCS